MDSASPFDPARVAAHRARAARRFEDVLVARVAEELAERADGVNRAFGPTLAIGDAGRFRAAVAARSSLAKRIDPLTEMDRVARLAPNGVVGDQEALPFAEGSFGLIVSTLSLHWANDIVGALIQARRALRPDGLLLASFFGGRTLTELRESLLVAESDVTGGASPRVAPFADVMDGANLLQRAGFTLPVADTDIVTLRYREPLKLFADLRAMGETSALRARVRPLTREVIARAMAHYAERFSDADGRLRATFEIITLTGWAPHESQQKPLAPGSAKTRLADALSVKEISAGEAAPPPGRKTP